MEDPIPHSFIGHIWNDEVRQHAGSSKLPALLQYQQLLLLGRVAILPKADVQKRCTFQSASCELECSSLPGSRGAAKTHIEQRIIQTSCTRLWKQTRFF